MPMSAYFWLWQMSAPERPIRALESTRAIILVELVLTPKARIMYSLLPVARSAEPISVPKNQYRMATMATASTMPRMMATVDCGRPVMWLTDEKMVPLARMGVLDLPMMRRLMDHRLICVRIPARIAGISKTVVKMPVTAPAMAPAHMPASTAIKGSTLLLTMSTAQTQPPRAKLPSQVISGMSSRRNVINTPSTIMPQRTPCETAPCNAMSMLHTS